MRALKNIFMNALIRLKETSSNYIDQYKFLFYLTWIILYFIFPAWRFSQIYISFTGDIIQAPFPPKLILLTYFFVSAFLLNFYFKSLFADGSLIIHSPKWSELVKNNLWIVLVCGTAAFLHIMFPSPVNTGAAAYSLWIYNFIVKYWHRLFDFSIQYFLWLFLFIMVLIVKQERLFHFILSLINSWHSLYKSNFIIKFVSIASLVGIFILYSRLLPGYHWQDHLYITGYPPLGTLLHLIIYLLFGTGDVSLAPGIVQFTFYILSGVFLYKTINLFTDKKTALLGASIFLFSPLVFSYATSGHQAAGAGFFIILVSYFFLKLIKKGNDRDLILTSYSISLGSLFRSDIIYLFALCSAYLIICRIKKKDLDLWKHLKVLSLAPITFLPWYFVGTRGGDGMVLSHLTAFDSLISSFLMIPSQLSWPVYSLFLISTAWLVIYKRNHLSLFFAFIYIPYYLLYTSLEQQTVHRYTMAFYPTISVFLSLFINDTLHKFRWRYAFTLASSVLIVYLAVLCVIPRSSTKLITFKYTDFENQSDFPVDDAMEWIKNETGKDERVLAFSFDRYEAAAREKGIDPNTLYPARSELTYLSTPDDIKAFRQDLRELCNKLKINYIVFCVYSDRISDPYYNNMFRENGFIRNLILNIKIREKELRIFLKDTGYDEQAKFELDGNSIYVYKLSNTSTGKNQQLNIQSAASSGQI